MAGTGWDDRVALPEHLEDALKKYFPGGWVVVGYRRNGLGSILTDNADNLAAIESVKLKAIETLQVWGGIDYESSDEEDKTDG